MSDLTDFEALALRVFREFWRYEMNKDLERAVLATVRMTRGIDVERLTVKAP